jgi:peptidyl-prolyl cis-trans isomerase D
MISWIQRYFQHHFRTIFAIILGLMIISFVFTIGPSGFSGRGDRRVAQRKFFDYNLSSQEGQQRLMGDASISASLQLGSMGGLEPEQVQSYAFQRAASLHLADELHLPAATANEVTDFIKGLRTFIGQDGQFDATTYKNFRDSLKTNPRITEADIARVLADDVRAQKLQKLVAGPGYVLPNDVKLQLARSDTSWTLATATADYATFAPDLKPADAELTKFFEDNVFRYEIPPRVVASFVGFPSSAHAGAVNLTEAEVRAYYDANPARFPKPQTPNIALPPTPTLQTDPTADFAAVRPQVETALKLERAQALALKAASEFVLSVYQGKVTQGPALDSLLASRKLAAQPLAPFTRERGPLELGGSPEIADASFKLDQNRYYTDALPAPAGAVVLFWKETLPSQKPPFTEVRAKVASDYVENEKRKRFVELGRTLRTQLETRLKAGDNFEKAVAALPSSNGLKFQVKTLPAFTARTRPQDMDYSILGALEHLEKGQVSDMAVSADKGIFVYAADKQTPDLSETNPQYAATRTQLGAYTARLASGAIIGELVEKELKRSEPKVE